MFKLILCFLIVAMLHSTPAYAYIGPGAGAGAIIVIFGIVASIFLAFVAVLWYPFKRLLKKRKSKNKLKEEQDSDKPDDSDSTPA